MVPFILFSVGGALVSAGAWMAWHPAGPICAGAVLIYIAAKSLSGQKSE